MVLLRPFAVGFSAGSTIEPPCGFSVFSVEAGGAEDLSLLLIADGSNAGIFRPIGPMPMPISELGTIIQTDIRIVHKQ